MPKRFVTVLAAVSAVVSVQTASAQQARETPYWASISASRAMMRTGPGRNYPATWLYVRADLPVRIVEVYRNWRKVEDHDGGTGWMLVNLLSDTRTAIVRGDEPQPLHEARDAGSSIRYRAEPGVVGRISDCARGWCYFDVRGKAGYVRSEHLWGAGSDETS